MDVLDATLPTWAVVVPVAIGSSVPTWMRAGRLSDARIEGDERTLNRESACKAFTNAAMSLPPKTPLIPPPNTLPVGKALPRVRMAPAESNFWPKYLRDCVEESHNRLQETDYR